MAIKFTTDQQKVIDARHVNVLVSAAAGSGKTAVLVERIVQLVCNPENNTDIDELLVVTFTKAAASEMRERIHTRISEELEKNPLSTHLQRQYALVHRSMITTIDSFCQNVLRNHFQEIDLDPDFRVMDEGEKSLMRLDVLGELLEEKYAEGSEEFLRTVDFFTAGAVDDSAIEKYILELQNYAESFARPNLFLEERKKDHVHTLDNLQSGALGDFALRYFKGMLEGFAESYRLMKSVVEEPDGPDAYGERVDEELEILEKANNISDIDSIGKLIDTYLVVAGNRLKPVKGDHIDSEKKEAVKKARDDAKKKIKELADTFFSPSLENRAYQSDLCSEYVNCLIDLTISFRQRLLERKRDKKVVDFGDLEHYALEILTNEDNEPTKVAEEYRDHFKEIMVDEYQDSNEIQDVILNAIARKTPGTFDRFMVGDVKQSIYGFRQARPDLFLEKYDSYPITEGCERIDLSQNFRSREEVLGSVNDIFDRIMHKETGKIEYDEASRLNASAKYPIVDDLARYNFNTELILLDSKLNDEIKDEDADYTGNESEALVIAQTIKNLMSTQKVTLVKKVDGEEVKELRPLEYGDIVVLHRSPSSMAEALKKILEEMKIPISVSQGKGYFSVTEVTQVLQLLRAINNPKNDIALYGAMHSVFGGYNDIEIANMRAADKKSSFYDIVKKGAPSFIEKLEKYRKMATYKTIRELLQFIFDEHNYIDYVTAMPGGVKRRANVEKLLSYASDFEKTSYFGLYHFVRYIDQLEKYTEDSTAEADVLGDNANVVRFMSIHKSKGLEFPVTILAGMGHGFMDKDQTAPLNHDNELGIGCEYVDLERMTKQKTIRHALIAKKIKEDSRAEELRLLYVAMTRAKEKLIMIGRAKDADVLLEKSIQRPSERLSYNKFITSRCPLDFVLPVLGYSDIESRVIEADDIELEKMEEQLVLGERKRKLENASSYSDAEKVRMIKDRLSYVYPFKYLEKLTVKTTVSELKMSAMLEENEEAAELFSKRERKTYIPTFRQEKKEITGTVRGDAYHRFMEVLDFDYVLGFVVGSRPSSYEEFLEKINRDDLLERLDKYLDELQSIHKISPEYHKAINKNKIAEFLVSELSYRMWMSNVKGALYREQPFVLSVNASLLGNDYPDKEKVIIQGIIDAFFENDEKCVILIDYKTDSVASDEELVSRYKAQLDYYQEAIETLTGKKVIERYLYSFHLGKAVKCF